MVSNAFRKAMHLPGLVRYGLKPLVVSGPRIRLSERLLSTKAAPEVQTKGIYTIATKKTEVSQNAADLPARILELSERDVARKSLSSLLDFGRDVTDDTLLRSSQFLYEELPIRLAKCVTDLSFLPHDLSNMAAIKEVRSWYISSFEDIVRHPCPQSIEDERKFTNQIKEIYERHSGVLWNIARGVHQLKSTATDPSLKPFSPDSKQPTFLLPLEFPGIQTFLDNFFLSRLGIRMLIGQHIALHEHIDDWVGLFCLHTSPIEIAQSAANFSSRACRLRYNLAPQVEITVDSNSPGSDESFPYIPAHMHHILFELLKNSMRATIEKIRYIDGFDKNMQLKRMDSGLLLPPIQITISSSKDRDERIIEVVDQGGGFPSSAALKNAWSYMYTTAAPHQSEELFEELHRCRGRDFNANEKGLPLAGMGYGLPIARVFAKYLGGDISIENYGKGAKARLTLKSVEDSLEAV